MVIRNANPGTGDAGAQQGISEKVPCNSQQTGSGQDRPTVGLNALADLATRIRAEHEATAAAMKRGCEHAIRAGELLIEAKRLLEHGEWLPWLAEHCDVPERTARLYMRLAQHKFKIGNVADMTVRGAIKALAAPPAEPSGDRGDKTDSRTEMAAALEQQQLDNITTHADFMPPVEPTPKPEAEPCPGGEPAKTAMVALSWLVLAVGRDPQLADHLATIVSIQNPEPLPVSAIERVITLLTDVVSRLCAKPAPDTDPLDVPGFLRRSPS